MAKRTREIGIRMALGSTRGLVLRQVLTEALGLVVVAPSDPVSYVIAVGLIGVTAVVAAVVPARRAASVEPLIGLRTN